MGKVKIEIYCYLIADILTKVLQTCSWSSPLQTEWIFSKSLTLIGGHGNRNVKFSKKIFKNLLLRSRKGDEAETLHKCLCYYVFIAPLWKSGGYTGFALSFHQSVILWFCHSVTFQMKVFVTLFSGTVRPRRLKLGTDMDSGQMYRNQAAAAYSSFYFFIFLSLQFQALKLFRHTFLRNCEA